MDIVILSVSFPSRNEIVVRYTKNGSEQTSLIFKDAKLRLAMDAILLKKISDALVLVLP